MYYRIDLICWGTQSFSLKSSSSTDLEREEKRRGKELIKYIVRKTDKEYKLIEQSRELINGAEHNEEGIGGGERPDEHPDRKGVKQHGTRARRVGGEGDEP